MSLTNEIKIVSHGKRADIGKYKIDRILPNRKLEAVGPFVFLDYLLPSKHGKESLLTKPEGTGPHPHRGIATLTYVLNGQAEHYDSKGNHALVKSGGVQWMKAGNGIIHDESINIDPTTDELITHSFQFWIDLPAKNKKEDPEYLALQANDVPKLVLDNQSGWIKIVAGEFQSIASKIPSYTRQFIYHVHLESGKYFCLKTIEQMEYAAFLLDAVVINDEEQHAGDFLGFDRIDGEIQIKNVSATIVDLLLFGGEPYTEPIIAAGPFVMNTEHEISLAYNDFYDGKYGQINYEER